MSIKTLLAATLAVAFGISIAISMPMNSAFAQATTTKEGATKDKTADKKTKSEIRKAKKAEKAANRKAAQDRQKQCGAEWKKARAEGKVEKGMIWPKYWSACSKRLKEKTA